MKTLKNAIKKLTWIDAILWGQMVVIVLIGLALQPKESKVMLNNGIFGPITIQTNESFKIGESVQYNGINYIVVDKD